MMSRLHFWLLPLILSGCIAASPAPAPTAAPTPTPTATPTPPSIGPKTIYLVRPDGADLTELALGRDPLFSSDGDTLSFIQPTDGGQDLLMLYDRATRETTPVDLSGQELDYAWAPDGRSIAAAVHQESGDTILLIDPSARTSQQIASRGRPGSVQWSSDSRFLSWVETNAGDPVYYPKPIATPAFQVQTRLMVVDMQTRQPAVLLAQPNAICSPDWSPDGKQIVFASGSLDWCFSTLNSVIDYGVPAQRIYRVSVPDGALTRASQLDTLAYYVRWSPHGDALADLDLNRQGEITVRILDAASSRERHADNMGRIDRYGLTWSPDGSKLVVAGGTIVFVYDTGTFARQTLLGGPAGYWPEGWSPDGHHLLIGGSCCGVPGFLLADTQAPGKDATIYQALVDAYSLGGPAWSPDGAWIAFWAFRGCDHCG